MIKPICPHCLIPLERKRQKNINFYFCHQCWGSSYGMYALKNIVEPETVIQVWQNARTAAPSQLDCSHCRKPMRQVFQLQKGPELDVCLHCHLVWLDNNELEQLPLAKSIQGKDDEVAMEARKHLALLQIQQVQDAHYGKTVAQVDSPGGFRTILSILGLPVEESTDSFQQEPYITWLLILICLLVSTYGFRHPQEMLAQWAFRPDISDPARELLTGISAFFFHANWLHLISNLYFLWIFGDNVEDEIGKSKYLLLVLLATFGGHLAFAFLNPNHNIPTIGASGGIFGIITFYILCFPKRRFVFFFWFRWLSISGWLFAALYFLKEIIGALVQMSGSTDGVSHLSHLGGAAVGFLFWLLYRRPESISKS